MKILIRKHYNSGEIALIERIAWLKKEVLWVFLEIALRTLQQSSLLIEPSGIFVSQNMA